jgi:surfeit locus 1 family protein
MSRTPAPTHGQVMRRPRWIGALLLALLVAGGFAGLAQWQLGHAVQLNTEAEFDSEAPVALGELNPAGTSVGDMAAGRVATVDGAFVPGDFRVVEDRVNGGVTGAWVVGHLVTETTPEGHLAVAIGWAADAAEAEAALGEIDDNEAIKLALEGRYMPAEGPVLPKPSEDPDVLRSMLPGQLANLWSSVDGPVYSGFLVAHSPEAGLVEIDSVPPLPQETVNWLNLFYAVEWVVFAGFALFFWYRITRDAWEKEMDQLAQDGETAAGQDRPRESLRPSQP